MRHDRALFIEAAPMRALWRAVLFDQLRVLLTGSPRPLGDRAIDVHRARSWFGSADFRLVCALAGLDPDYVDRKVRPLLDLPCDTREALVAGRSQGRIRLVPRGAE